jgi:hypothetical protein
LAVEVATVSIREIREAAFSENQQQDISWTFAQAVIAKKALKATILRDRSIADRIYNGAFPW